jgi:DNA-binding response OmpR family regulator
VTLVEDGNGTLDALVRRLLGDMPDDYVLAEVRKRRISLADALSDEALEAEATRRDYTIFRGDRSRDLPGLFLDTGRRVATWNDCRVGLSGREVDVLSVLMGAHPRPVSSAHIAAAVWRVADQYAVQSTRVYIGYLRRKLPDLICTIGARGTTTGRYYLALETEKPLAVAS